MSISTTILRVAHFYPHLMNLYGDRGNLLALQMRASLRSIQVEIIPVQSGEGFDGKDFDAFFMGGGQDKDQAILHQDLIKNKAEGVIKAVQSGLPGLCICGGFQMMGKYYRSSEGERLEGLGIFPTHTEASDERFVGDILTECQWLSEEGKDPYLIGFENHAGKTYLDDRNLAFATVRCGKGNNGMDSTEGCHVYNLFGTYLHGSFLPKNPAFTDAFIQLAIRHQLQDPSYCLIEADSSVEERARKVMLDRFGR